MSIRIRFQHVAAALALCAHATLGGAVDLGRQIDFAIPAQKLDAALMEFSRQAKVQIIASTAELRNLTSAGVQGNLTLEQALKKLLADSGLAFKSVGESAVSIGKPGRTPPASSVVADVRQELRLVRIGADEADAGDETNEAAVEPDGEDAAAMEGIPELLVKGRRSANTGIRRTENDVQPYVVFDAEEIDRSMAGNVEEFLATRLPMNASAGPWTPASGLLVGNQSSVDLRGMGTDQTLILVNGRRVPGVASGTDFSQPDINGIPLSSVERIEVLPSTAGGIYGGGATGGVINIVLKSDYSGLDVGVRYETPFDTDASRRRIEGSAGFSLEGGRTQVLLRGSYADSHMLMVGDRDFLARGRQLLLENNAASLTGSSIPPVGSTSNIISADGQPLVLKATGQSLGSAIAHVPLGYAGPESDAGAAFLGTAGRYNLALPSGAMGLDRALTFTPRVTSASLDVRRRFTDHIEGFVTSSWSENKSRSAYGQFSPGMYTLAAGAPNNPFEQAIRVRHPGSDFHYGEELLSWPQMLNAGGGLTVHLPRDWSVQGEYNWSRSRMDLTYTPFVITNDGRAALGDGRLDILRDGGAYPLDYSPYYFTPSPNRLSVIPAEAVLEVATLRLAGPLLHLPGGPLRVAALLEQREQESGDTMLETYFVPDVPRYYYYPSRGQTTASFYAEMTAPLISAANALPLARGLDLQMSYRRDETRTRSPANSTQSAITLPSPDTPLPDIVYTRSRVQANQYTVGLRYRPVDALALRMSYGEGVLPPSLSQLVPTNINGVPMGLTDPKRNDDPVTVLQDGYSVAGNVSLRPESSRSVSAGVIFLPRTLPGLRLSVDYTRIRKIDEITNLMPQALLDLENVFPGRVVRDDLTPADEALGYEVGVVRSLAAGNVNIFMSELEAYDVQADYHWDTAWGSLRANLVATHTPRMAQQVQLDQPVIDQAGYSGGVLQWRGNGGLSWERDAWSAGWNMQYYDSYYVYRATSTTASRNSSILDQGSSRIPRQMYHDVFVKYRFGAVAGTLEPLSGVELMLGIANVLDKSPPIMATSSTSGGGYSTYGDPRLRRYTLSVRKSFGGP